MRTIKKILVAIKRPGIGQAATLRKAAQLAHQQFDNGYTGLLDVLVAERDLLAAQSAQSVSDASLRKDLVNIYAAAGGGWDVAPAKQK